MEFRRVLFRSSSAPRTGRQQVPTPTGRAGRATLAYPPSNTHADESVILPARSRIPLCGAERIGTTPPVRAFARRHGGLALNHSSDQKFTYEEMKEGVEYAHSLGKKIYCTVNVMPKNSEIDALIEHLKRLDEVGVDAVL